MEQIKNALISRLADRDPELPVYDEQIKQGFQEPCFFVLQMNSGQNKEVNRRYRRGTLINIRYFSKSDSLDTNAECNLVAEQLYEQLEYVEWHGTLYRGMNMRHEIVDGVLHFFLSYGVYLVRQKAAVPKMQRLEQEGHIRYD